SARSAGRGWRSKRRSRNGAARAAPPPALARCLRDRRDSRAFLTGGKMSLVVTTRSGLFCLNGEDRTAFGEDRDFLALARAPGSHSVYAGTTRGGVCRSDDGGLSWSRLTN